jgi:hypothetical protein
LCQFSIKAIRKIDAKYLNRDRQYTRISYQTNHFRPYRTMDLSQTKLSKTEWVSIEMPVNDAELAVLRLIQKGFFDVNVRENANLSLLALMKLENSPSMAHHLYTLYFADPISVAAKRFLATPAAAASVAGKQLSKFIKDTVALPAKVKAIKKIDAMRVANMHLSIDNKRVNIFEFQQIEFCHAVLDSLAKKTGEYAFYLYTLTQLRKATISCTNSHVAAFVDIVIGIATARGDALVQDTIHCAQKVIEQNPHIMKYADMTLYDHQKQLFQLFRAEAAYTPKLVMYTAPTGTGKTLSPIGLSESKRVIFVCAARHVGISLARSAVSVGKRVAFAFGCESADDVRLHYFAAVDYTRNKRSGGIGKVDNSNGANVDIMICDVRSYLTAMHYMLQFNVERDMVLYWDEPTISLDYETHPLHSIIRANWNQNKLSQVVLSCATLPREDEVSDTVHDFRFRFEGAEICTISSYDCKKSISLLDPEGKCVLPHFLFSEVADLQSCLANCGRNQSLLRYFDLGEVVRFIELASARGLVPEPYRVDRYFSSISDITMASIKTYYLEMLGRISPLEWGALHAELVSHRKSKFPHSPSAAASGGIFATTLDAYTITDGPAIFLAEDVSHIGEFYLGQLNLPAHISESIMARIAENNIAQEKIDKLDRALEDKMADCSSTKDKNGDAKAKDKKIASERFSPEIKRMMSELETAQASIRSIAMDARFVPNTPNHQMFWRRDKPLCVVAFSPSIDEDIVREIMSLPTTDQLKMLLLIGVGVFSLNQNPQYVDLMKRLASEQKLFMVIATSDYIYGTNYNFCHGFLGKDLVNMTQQKIIQSIGRIGRGNIQQEYTIRVRDSDLLRRLFMTPEHNTEADNMRKLFCSDEA